MGQIKNIKLHIVTDIKCNQTHTYTTSWSLTHNNNSQHDEGNNEIWQTPQQVAHFMCTMWSFLIPHTEEGVRIVWLPECKNPKLQLGFQGEEKKDNWYRTYATSEESSSTQYQRIPRGYLCQVSEEVGCTVDDHCVLFGNN